MCDVDTNFTVGNFDRNLLIAIDRSILITADRFMVTLELEKNQKSDSLLKCLICFCRLEQILKRRF